MIPLSRLPCLGWGIPLLAALLLIQALHAEGVVDTCTETAFEAAFEQALVGGGLVTLKCTAANRLTSVKIISEDTVITNATENGSLTTSGSNRFFHILPGVSLTLQNLVLSGGRADGADGADGTGSSAGQDGQDSFGGAIYNEGGSLIATGVTFTGNQATGGNGGQGSGVQQLGGQPTQGGAGGDGRGGAIYSLGGSNTLTGCTFESNRAEGGAGGNGGSSTGYLRNGADGGPAGESAGGAIFLTNAASLQVINCQFEDNTSQGAQGGIGGQADGLVYFDGFYGASTMGRGGAICQEGGTSVLENSCEFSENIASGADGLSGSPNAGNVAEAMGQAGLPGHGGAIAIDRGSLTADLTTFNFNSAKGGVGGNGGLTAGAGDGGDGGSGASGQGSAIHATGSATLRLADCSFGVNSALGGFGGFGMLGLSELAQTGTDGSAATGEGGAVYFGGASLEINRCTFDGNQATGAEGLEGFAGNAYQPGNQGSSGGSGVGGAVLVASGIIAITNATFHANSASGGNGGNGGNGGSGLAFPTDGGDGGNGGSAQGGALWTEADSAGTIVHSTFANNEVIGGDGGDGGAPGDANLANPGEAGQDGAGLGASLHSKSANIRLRGALLANPTSGDNASGNLLDDGHNMSSDATPPYLPPSTSWNFVKPLLGILTQNDGPTRTMALQDESPAIDFAHPLISLVTDQRGVARDLRPDVGAYEVVNQPPPLTIQISPNALIVSWPDTGSLYTLQSAPSLTSPNWTLVTGAIDEGDRWTVSITPTSQERFFQLQY